MKEGRIDGIVDKKLANIKGNDGGGFKKE